MPTKLVVYAIHGMGSQKPDFAAGMIQRLQAGLTANLRAVVEWEPIYWADLLSQRQNRLWRRMAQSNDLDYVRLRKFIIGALGDAAAYQQVGPTPHNTYQRIHDRVLDRVNDVYNRIGATTVPCMVLAHSLGGHIMSNYIWDRQHGGREWERDGAGNDTLGPTPFHRFETLAGMVTFGCNIPLFAMAHARPEPIQFPPSGLANHFPPGTNPAHVSRVAIWDNYFDPDDVLGYPLKPLGDAYRKVVRRDREINAGAWYSSWNPLSHSGYWEDADFTDPVASQIAAVARLA